jgi:beta-lactamase class C
VPLILAGPSRADDATGIGKFIEQEVRPVMEEFGIPGMAVGIVHGDRRFISTYGVASRQTKAPVTAETLFEIGSVSKTFTAALASYAEDTGALSLADTPGKYIASLRGSALDKVTLLDLGTHTSGGMPLQVPAAVKNDKQLLAYFRKWKPDYPPGTYRTYANPSIGLLGMITAIAMKGDFATLMNANIFTPLALEHTFLVVPEAEAVNYAQGYAKDDSPARMSPGVLATEAYGVRTTIGDLLRFLEANMGMFKLDERLQRAILETHTGYFTVGAMTQDLIWEQYGLPVALPDLVVGNSAKLSLEANPVKRLEPPSPPRGDVLINKTGSTRGFGAYVAFIPDSNLGIVLLANKFYPNEARIKLAWEILRHLEKDATQK